MNCLEKIKVDVLDTQKIVSTDVQNKLRLYGDLHTKMLVKNRPH